MGFYKELNREKSYHRAIFLAAAVGLAGLCSLYPVMCFKKFSGKEKAKLNKQVEELEQRNKDDDEWERTHYPRHARRRSYSPPRTAHRPRHQRRHSSARDAPARQPRAIDGRERRHHRPRGEEQEFLEERRRRRENDRTVDPERFERHGGHPPQRRYRPNSWDPVLKPL